MYLIASAEVVESKYVAPQFHVQFGCIRNIKTPFRHFSTSIERSYSLRQSSDKYLYRRPDGFELIVNWRMRLHPLARSILYLREPSCRELLGRLVTPMTPFVQYLSG
jgi:hypothetical protein